MGGFLEAFSDAFVNEEGGEVTVFTFGRLRDFREGGVGTRERFWEGSV